MIEGKGKSAKRKGTRVEKEAAKALQREFDRMGSNLVARRVIGSGAWGGFDSAMRGDVKIERGGRIMERIEVKAADPNRKSGPITIAFMDKAREFRRILIAKHDRGEFLCSMWGDVLVDLRHKAGDMNHPVIAIMQNSTRGVTIGDVQSQIEGHGGLRPVQWGAAVYMDLAHLAELLDAAHADAEK